METVNKEFLTTEEAYSVLVISKAFFYQLRAKNNLPSYTLGGSSGKKNLFKRSDILNMVQPKDK
jgi:excisionase family DNA binding protein